MDVQKWLTGMDTRIQKRFDAILHESMRRFGWTKRGIRKSAWLLFIVLTVGRCALQVRGTAMGLVFYGMLALLAIWAFSVLMVSTDQDDATAEASPGTRSFADRPRMASLLKVLGIVFMALTIPLMFSAKLNTLSHQDTINAIRIATSLLFIFQGYLCGTSPQAPKPKKEEVPEGILIPAPAKT